MNLTWDGLMALIGCLVVAVLPLPRRAEGLRIGFFSAAMAVVFAEASRKSARVEPPAQTSAMQIVPELPPVSEDERINGADLLTGFSILRYLRRTGAVTDDEFESKKRDLLRRA